jgi:putative addiction module component (TIGR02574 family)
MPTTLEQLAAQGMGLSEEQRAALAQVLWASIEPTPVLSPEWEAEIVRRIADVDEGRVALIPAEEVFARMDAWIASQAALHSDA